MKDKAPLSLMELGIMLLVFALAAALCLQAFARADVQSRALKKQDEAVLMAQSAAETLKHCGGDFDKAAALLGGSWDGNVLCKEENGLTLSVTPEETSLSTLGRATVRVLDGGGQALALLPIAWQEVDGHD